MDIISFSTFVLVADSGPSEINEGVDLSLSNVQKIVAPLCGAGVRSRGVVSFEEYGHSPS